MKLKVLLKFALAVVAIAMVGCNEVPEELNHYVTDTSGPEPKPEGFNQVVVNVPAAVQLDESNQFAFEWETGDIFAVYEVDGEWAANFKISDAAANVKTFTAMNEAYLDNETFYIAMYPAPKAGEEGTYKYDVAEYAAALQQNFQKQEGATCAHLKDNCYMSVAFKGSDPITFEYLNAFATISFLGTAGEAPSTLKFEDGDKSYNVEFADLATAETDDDIYTAYMAINPAAAKARTQKFFVPADAAAPVRTIDECADNYATGVCYGLSTFTVESYTELTISMPAAISDKVNFAWADGNTVSLFDATTGAYVADCAVSNASESKFTMVGDATIDNRTNYVAVYPARQADEATFEAYQISANANIATQTQVGDNTTVHLSNECWMKAEFKGGEAATMAHQSAILELSFSIDATKNPTSLTFTDCSANYTLELDGFTGAASYTTYMAVTPTEATSREQAVAIVCDDESTQKYNTTCSDEYAVGTVSTASTDNMISASITQIGTVDQLVAYLADPSSDAILTANIDLAGAALTPSEAYLAKEFNGNGNTISNLSITSDGNDVALFKGINQGGVIKDLTLANPSLKGAQYIGAIAAKIMEGGSVINCNVTGATLEATNNLIGGIAGNSLGHIEGCSFEGTIIAAKGSVGGIAGAVSKSADSTDATYIPVVSDCESNATITAKGETCGGIVGKSTSTHITDCTVSGTINGIKNVGGVAGFTIATTIKNCVNNATITATNINTGGIAGNSDGSLYVEGCVNNGDVTSTNNVVGGIVGLSVIQGQAAEAASTVVFGCYNNGNVTGVNKVGGVIASLANGGTVVACYNSGDVTANSNSASTGKPVAGVIAESKVNSTIIGCYNVGTVTSSLAGYNAPQAIATPNGTSSVLECYYVFDKALGVDKGKKCADIAALNAVVDAMNTAINATDYASYNYVAGTDAAADAPTLIKK